MGSSSTGGYGGGVLGGVKLVVQFGNQFLKGYLGAVLVTTVNQSLLFQRTVVEILSVLHPRTIPDHGRKKGRVQDGRGGGQLGPDVEEEEDRGELRHEL